MSTKMLHIVSHHDDQSFDKFKFFNTNRIDTMFNFKRFNDTATIKQDILRRQMNSVNSSTNSRRINKFVYMPVMDTSFSSAVVSRPNTISKLSRQTKNETIISSNSKSDQETLTNTTKFSSNNIVYNLNNRSNKNPPLESTNQIDFKSYFNNRTSTPISNEMQNQKRYGSNYNVDSDRKKGGISNKDFIDLIVVLKTATSTSSSNSNRKSNNKK
jgi:hypothetical protein